MDRVAALMSLGIALGTTPLAAAAPERWPVQLEMRVPFEPTAFPSAGHTHLVYELYLTNFSSAVLPLGRVEVLDANSANATPIAAFEDDELKAMLQPALGLQPVTDRSGDRRQLAAGSSVVVFLWVALDGTARVPNKLRHRVVINDAATEGATIGTHNTKLHVLGSPVQGAGWLADDAPSNEQENHHRRGVVVVGGRAAISRRYAIDWQQLEKGALFSGNGSDVRSYYGYGKPVLAVADGRIVTAADRLPDNVPRHYGIFQTAVPITTEIIAGNAVTLDLGDGQFAHYYHLRPGSLRVKAGDRVRRGEVLASLGNSGDSRSPHLHFEVSTSTSVLAGEGVPYVIDKYDTESADGSAAMPSLRSLPLNHVIADFRSASDPLR